MPLPVLEMAGLSSPASAERAVSTRLPACLPRREAEMKDGGAAERKRFLPTREKKPRPGKAV